ncbi:MAG: RES domain-containing protein, partial [Betaproteobacteria bacterium]|nr:RES domain-containing protein [Betaproteobacteria bacterium]
MNSLFSKLTLADLHRDVARNIVSLRASQDFFDDLTDDSAEWSLA